MFTIINKEMKRIFQWLASLIEDKQGSISSKRVGFFLTLGMLNTAINVPEINPVVIYGIVALAFGLAGLTIPEWFSTINSKSTSTKIEVTKETEQS